MGDAAQHRVSAIKQQVKRGDRYSIFIDDAYAFSLSDSALLSSGLRVGQTLLPEARQELEQKAHIDKAYDRSLQLIARRPRSTWEVEQYLKRKSYETDIIKTIVERLQDKGYLDDAAFADTWVRNRRLLKSRSKRKLRQELMQKRVPDQIIRACLDADETDDTAVLRDLIEQKRKLSRYQDRQKLMRYLSGQGFSYGDITAALAEREDD